MERGERVNVKELLLEMRRYRMGLIQTAEQLRFSYLSIIEGAESMNIDLRRWMPPHIPGSASCSDSDSDSEDDSDNPEEVEEEDDVVSSEPVQFNQTSNSQHIIEGVNGDQGILANNDAEELPPPIPPRAESLMASPGSSINILKLTYAFTIFIANLQIMIVLFHLLHLNGVMKRWKFLLPPKPKKTLLRVIRLLRKLLAANVSESVGNKQKRPFQGWWQSILTIRL